MSANPYDRLPKLPSFELTSTDVRQGERLSDPQLGESAGGGDISPQLNWSGAPEATKSYVVTVYDPMRPRHPDSGTGPCSTFRPM
jgi:phosphatidylethanolamine-binding protein (PEBP) family uncharacterized protein